MAPFVPVPARVRPSGLKAEVELPSAVLTTRIRSTRPVLVRHRQKPPPAKPAASMLPSALNVVLTTGGK
jgi:hypothetical protein